MNGRVLLYRLTAVVLMIALFHPVVRAEAGGKYFKQGRKFEVAEQWELAAEQYALALNQDPGNPEFRLHLLRATAKASLMFMERGKVLMDQQDYEGAYQAFRQAYSYDNTNELALTRMKEILNKMGIPLDKTDLPAAEIRKASDRASALARPQLEPRKFRLRNYSFKNLPADQIIRIMAEEEGLNIVFDDISTKPLEKKTNFDIKGMSAPQALETFLATIRYGYVPLKRRTILILPEQQVQPRRQSLQALEETTVRTFYIRNAPLTEVRAIIQNTFGTKQINELKPHNALVVRDTASNIKLIEALLYNLEKAQSEVVVDINFYEVNDTEMMQIGNQITTSASKESPFSSLGTGFGGINFGLKNTPNVGFGIFGGNPIFALAAPPTILSLLQSKSKSRLIASTQVRSFDNQQARVNFGSKVPVQTATIPTGFVSSQPNQGGNGQNGPVINPTSFGVAQFQYENVGINIELKPQVLNDYVQMDMKIESTGVAAGTNQFNPTFTQRRTEGMARIKEGETAIVASVMRVSNMKSRSGLPVLSFIPVVGRLISTPAESGDATNVVITVTPHILRTPEITAEDQLALSMNGGSINHNTNLSLEEFISRSEVEERLLSAAAPGGPAQTIATNSPQIQPVSASSAPPVNAAPAATEKITENSVKPAVSGPVKVKLQALNAQLKAGQSSLLGLILISPDIELTSAAITINYNPKVIKITSVKDGGLFSLNGAQAEFNFTDTGNQIVINAQRPSSAAPVKAHGQVALIYCQALAEGSADVQLSSIDLRRSNGSAAEVFTTDSNITVIGNAPTPPPPAQDDDEDEDEDEDE